MLLASFLEFPWIFSRNRDLTEIEFIVGALVLWFVFVTVREKWRVRRTRNWPTVEGEISNLKFEKVWGGVNGIDYWKFTINFTYIVTGQPASASESGSYPGKYTFNCKSEEMAQGALAGLKDKPVKVHYNPKEVAKGILWEDDVWDIWWDTYWEMTHPDEAATENQS